MTNNENPLPEYNKPPIIEVVCGAQFEEIRSLTTIHYGEFWQRIKKEYPKTEDQPPLREVLEFQNASRPGVRIEAFDIPPLRRVFFVDHTDNFLLQVQPTRFLANWRKRSDTDEYPRFSKAYDHFKKGWDGFSKFVVEMNGTRPSVNQFELTYINHIFEQEVAFPLGMNRYLSLLSLAESQSESFLPTPSSLHSRLKFALPNSAGVLHITIGHGHRNVDRKKVLVIDLTARGPSKDAVLGMKEWFLLAHEWIVRGFTDITSSIAHDEWERTR